MGQHPGRRAEPYGQTPAGMGELRWHLELPESTSPSGHSSWVLRMLLVPLTIQGAEEQRAFGMATGSTMGVSDLQVQGCCSTIPWCCTKDLALFHGCCSGLERILKPWIWKGKEEEKEKHLFSPAFLSGKESRDEVLGASCPCTPMAPGGHWV